MPQHKCPDCYAAPLKSKKDIVEFLTGHESYNRGFRSNSPLAWDVKCGGVDFDANHLIEVYRNSGDYNTTIDHWLDYPEWRESAIAKLDEISEHLFEWAIEGARRTVEESAPQYLWDGRCVDSDYEFAGRSGGWLILTKFQGADLSRMGTDDFLDFVNELDFRALHLLYVLVVQNDYDYSRKQAIIEVEYQAAFQWIENACGDIPRPTKTQMKLTLDFTENSR